MIKSFKDKRTAAVFTGQMPKGFPTRIGPVSRRKLAMLDRAIILNDLKVPPNNQLETLTRDRAGQHSIRINRQFRLCFIWRDGHAWEVEIVDYH
ncbi:type II toxin-antitoxin system RelE/ParE family toxin [Roseomonas chloroacetimidivorans]|uniref:type II toxin-antitoxin system RelE/ParE family toxin n=1 Tax=Roseomonas chloroacetimidivorans TaxID=1766656 RepID=UPI003C7878BC